MTPAASRSPSRSCFSRIRGARRAWPPLPSAPALHPPRNAPRLAQPPPSAAGNPGFSARLHVARRASTRRVTLTESLCDRRSNGACETWNGHKDRSRVGLEIDGRRERLAGAVERLDPARETQAGLSQVQQNSRSEER